MTGRSGGWLVGLIGLAMVAVLIRISSVVVPVGKLPYRMFPLGLLLVLPVFGWFAWKRPRQLLVAVGGGGMVLGGFWVPSLWMQTSWERIPGGVGILLFFLSLSLFVRAFRR